MILLIVALVVLWQRSLGVSSTVLVCDDLAYVVVAFKSKMSEYSTQTGSSTRASTGTDYWSSVPTRTLNITLELELSLSQLCFHL